MTLSPEKLDELYVLAKKATPGPWKTGADYLGHALRPFDVVAKVDSGGGLYVTLSGNQNFPDEAQADAEFVAAASPDVVTALIDRVRELEGERKENSGIMKEAEEVIRAIGDEQCDLTVYELSLVDRLNKARAALNKEST